MGIRASSCAPGNVTAVLVRPDLGPLSPPLPLPGMSTAGRLGQALVRVLPADTRERWPLLAAAALPVIVALACALALLPGGLPDGNGAPTAARSAMWDAISEVHSQLFALDVIWNELAPRMIEEKS